MRGRVNCTFTGNFENTHPSKALFLGGDFPMSFLEISPKILQFMVREVQLGEKKKHPLRTPSRPDHTIFDLKDHLILGKITSYWWGYC